MSRSSEICGVCEFMDKTFKIVFPGLTDESKRMLMLHKENNTD